jgi:hypothetical protein
MDNKAKKDSLSTETIADFGEDFGVLTKQNIAEIFVDIHASISPLDPLNKC